jgi:5-methyltetrahydropteroyltriglutamate--homocysteine methyltransferase
MMVGSYPKPRWYNGLPYSDIPIDDYFPDSMGQEALSDCITAIVEDQERAGLDVITDGLVLGGDGSYASKLYYVTARLQGLVNQGPAIGLPVYSRLFAPTVKGKVARRGQIMGKQVRALRRATDKPIKVNYPGLQTLWLGCHNTFYNDLKDLAFDLARVFNEEFREVVDEGCDIIQIDEFTWHYGMSAGDWEIDAFNSAFEGVDAQVIVHVCWGNYGATPGYLPSSPEAAARQMEGSEFVLSRRESGATTARAEAIFPRVNHVKLDFLNYEIGHYGVGDLKALADNDWQGNFIAGIIDVKNMEIETADEVADRIRACLAIVPAARLGLSTDCGMINMPRMICQDKLGALVDGAAIVRQELQQATARLS